jgi:hypothetical protein
MDKGNEIAVYSRLGKLMQQVKPGQVWRAWNSM